MKRQEGLLFRLFIKSTSGGLGHSSVGRVLASHAQTLGSILSTTKKNHQWKRGGRPSQSWNPHLGGEVKAEFLRKEMLIGNLKNQSYQVNNIPEGTEYVKVEAGSEAHLCNQNSVRNGKPMVKVAVKEKAGLAPVTPPLREELG
ncbi:Hypothetical predicted protein [Marmota monax]|uniref:Uncharacterized protein n=1 Tax=Marmota monax TaxID=9995 RepID=A0A5E4AEP7_MARMO|nr:Hypothetical predicted protein [Marmota monax]